MNPTMFDQIDFDRRQHRYRLQGKILTPATELVASLERETNWDDIAKKVSQRDKVSVKTLKKSWEQKKNLAAKKGHDIHKYIERRLKFKTEQDSLYPEMRAFDSFWSTAKSKMSPIAVEMIVGDYHLGIGGTIDCLFYSTNTYKHHPFDWKTNEKFTQTNGWQTLKEPFEDLEDCHLTKYSIQLSIYKVILRRNTDMMLGDSFIVWLNSGYQTIKALDLTDRVEKWLIDRT